MTKKPAPRIAKPTSYSARGDWRRGTLDRIRALIHEADPDAVEEAKWKKATSEKPPVDEPSECNRRPSVFS